MKIEITEQEANNVKVALIQLAKSPQISEDGMKILLVLSDKFTVKEEVNNKEK